MRNLKLAAKACAPILTLLLLCFGALAQTSESSRSPSTAPSTRSVFVLPTLDLSVSSPPQDDPIALAIEKATNRALQAEKENVLLREQNDLLKAWLADKNETIAILKEQKGGLGEANKLRQEARAIDLERIADRDKIIAQQRDEINRLRHPGILASIFDKRSITGAVAGFAACKFTNGGTTNPFPQFSNQFNQLFAQDQRVMFQQNSQDAARKAFLKTFEK